MSEESKSGMPPELLAALTTKLESTNREDVQHHAAHMISVLADAASKLSGVSNLCNVGQSTLQGVLQAIDKQVGLLEAPNHTKQ